MAVETERLHEERIEMPTEEVGEVEGREIAVADTLDALWRLGAAGRARLRGPVVAVLSGGNIEWDGLRALLDANGADRGR